MHCLDKVPLEKKTFWCFQNLGHYVCLHAKKNCQNWLTEALKQRKELELNWHNLEHEQV